MVTQGKAIWRQAGDSQIYYITSGQGTDEFIIAPYLKTATIHTIIGEIKPSNPSAQTAFFKAFELSESPSLYSTSELHYTQAVNQAVEAARQQRQTQAQSAFINACLTGDWETALYWGCWAAIAIVLAIASWRALMHT